MDTLERRPEREAETVTPDTGRATVRRSGLALGAWALLIVVAHIWGRRLLDSGLRIKLGPEEGAPPIVGDIDLRLGLRIVPALVLAAAAVAFGPRLAERLPWRLLVVGSGVAAAAWAVALAFAEPGELTGPLLNTGEYLHDVGRVGDHFEFLRRFTDRIADYAIHVEGHPPGMLLIFDALDRAGLRGPGWGAALVIAVGAVAPPAVLVTTRAVSREVWARSVAPYVVFAPAAVWAATSADSLYMGVIAAGVALLALAGRPRPPALRRRADLLAVASGLLFGVSLFLTYGAVVAAAIAGAVALCQQRWRPVLVAGAAVVVVVAAFALAGFWWVEGLLATRVRYYDGVASIRPYRYFLVANLAAFALVVGPAIAVALSRLRREGPWLVVVGALVAVALADLSGMSKAEVERIWLPFAPWVILASYSLARASLRERRAWLALQASSAVAIQIGVRTPW